jgi:hypothetical protein
MMRLLVLTLVTGLLAACGGGGGSAPAATTPPPPPTPPANNAPTISGTPPSQVAEGQVYAFTPTASDADGDTLSFSVANPPAWATFDTGDGSLSGTPDATHIGTTLDVTISVSDGTDSASLAPFDLEVLQAPLGSATVSWTIPTTNADGSPLTDLARFNVHYGRSPGSYSRTDFSNNPLANSMVITDLEAGTWYFVVTAEDAVGNESVNSTEVSKDVVP